MTTHHSPEVLAANADIVAPPAAPSWNDHSFELPPAIYIAMGALFFGFIAVLSMAFLNPAMAVPFAVCALFIVVFFTVPVIFVRTAPTDGSKPLRWSRFMEKGVAIEHGRCSGGEAAVLVLMLPALIFCFGVAIATIVALV